MKYDDYRHIIPVQIRFSDVDRLNHVNNACYHTYVELGRVAYFDQVLRGAVEWDKQGFILARTEMDHLAQVHLNDEIFCCTKIAAIGTKSITMKNAIIRKERGELKEVAAVKGVLVAMDYTLNQSIAVPQRWRELIEAFEAGS